MTTPAAALSQDELKTLVGQAALQYVQAGEIVGVGTGSTVNKFIDALATIKDQIRGAVSSSVASTERLKALGIVVFDANEVESLSVYIDGADEIDGQEPALSTLLAAKVSRARLRTRLMVPPGSPAPRNRPAGPRSTSTRS